MALEFQANRPGPHLQRETYGAPVPSVAGSSQRHRRWLDPVAILAWGAQATAQQGLNPHSHQALAARRIRYEKM